MANKMQKQVTLLKHLYQEIYGPDITIANLNEFATELSRLAGRNRPWTGKFLHSLIKGYAGFSVNKKLVDALAIMDYRRKGLDDVQAQATEAKVLAVNDLPAGTVILGQPQRCATPGCRIMFVPTHPRQKYHSKTCAEIQRRRKNRNLSKAA